MFQISVSPTLIQEVEYLKSIPVMDSAKSVLFTEIQNQVRTSDRGLAVMRPACHLDTQNTVF